MEDAGNDLSVKKAATQITVFSAAQYVEGFLARPLKEAGFQNVNFTETVLDKYTASLAQDCQIVCIFVNDQCDAKVVERLAKCGVKLIALRCAGFDRVDLEACKQHGIKVVRVPTYSPTSVAEHAVALLMALTRRLAQAHVRVSAGNYSLTPLVGQELRGKRAAVLGTGAIGTEAVRILKGIGMEVVAYDIQKNPAVEAMGVKYVDLEEALPWADVVSVHVPLLKSTHHFINGDRIAMMKKGAILLNVSRGGLVDSQALYDGLENGQLGGLGMDVYENEGELFFTDWTDMPLETRMANWDRRFKLLTSYPQVLITPHSAFLTHEALANIASATVASMEEFLAGQPLTNELKPKPDKAAGAAR
ncbi:hypothetical protein OEZ85_009419 [Tetradesmus obliquus]|uniref:D-lactate dehydrogenase n=1 Tax=Tetradesmus obliquus TaxID=3088 RepID=A0ABY8UCV5_TETOB|nr:hypothetical protein OEZ85_009419 [Tetradesmus obliquus]